MAYSLVNHIVKDGVSLELAIPACCDNGMVIQYCAALHWIASQSMLHWDGDAVPSQWLCLMRLSKQILNPRVRSGRVKWWVFSMAIDNALKQKLPVVVEIRLTTIVRAFRFCNVDNSHKHQKIINPTSLVFCYWLGCLQEKILKSLAHMVNFAIYDSHLCNQWLPRFLYIGMHTNSPRHRLDNDNDNDNGNSNTALIFQCFLELVLELAKGNCSIR